MSFLWTDERVATLKNLWAEGYPASAIAAQFGGVTRNAVIGKLGRLGLTGIDRTSNAQTKAPRATAPDPAPARPAPAPETVLAPHLLAWAREEHAQGEPLADLQAQLFPPAPPIVPAPGPREKRRRKPPTSLQAAAALVESDDALACMEAEPPPDARVALSDLRGNQCHWPFGDPQHADFGYCGAPRHEPFPYCARHACLAYRPVEQRRQPEFSLRNRKSRFAGHGEPELTS